MEDAFASLPERYLGADPGFSATYRVLTKLGLRSRVQAAIARRSETALPESFERHFRLWLRLGWVGFDAANHICPTERYVRLACGFDAADAAPITGSRRGGGIESLTVDVVVRQQQQ